MMYVMGQRVKVYHSKLPVGAVGRVIALYADPGAWAVVYMDGNLGTFCVNASLLELA